MAYLVLAYPELIPGSMDKIQHYRKQYDSLYNIVEPHFTIVFLINEFSETEFIREVTYQANKFKKFDFIIRCATVNKDADSDYFNTFLVPDEGYSNMIRLHDKLYSEKFKEHLMLDISYIPHITIGGSSDKFLCKKLADEWNEKDLSIGGVISHLDIIKYENNIVTKVKTIDLK